MKKSGFKSIIFFIIGFILGTLFVPFIARAQVGVDYNPSSDYFADTSTYNLWRAVSSSSSPADPVLNGSGTYQLGKYQLSNDIWYSENPGNGNTTHLYLYDPEVYDFQNNNIPIGGDILYATQPQGVYHHVYIIKRGTVGGSSSTSQPVYYQRQFGDFGVFANNWTQVRRRTVQDSYGAEYTLYQLRVPTVTSSNAGVSKIVGFKTASSSSAYILGNAEVILMRQVYNSPSEDFMPEWWTAPLLEDIVGGIKNMPGGGGGSDPSSTGGYTPRAEGSIFSAPQDLQLFSSISGKNDNAIPLKYELHNGSDSLEYNIKLTIQGYDPVLNKWSCPSDLIGWFGNECDYIINNIKTTDGKYVLDLPDFIDEETLSDGSYRIRAELWTTTWYSGVYRNVINTISVYFNVGLNAYHNATGLEKPPNSDPFAWVGNIFGDDNPCGVDIACQVGLALERIFIPSDEQWIKIRNSFTGFYELLQEKFPFAVVFSTFELLDNVAFSASAPDYYPNITIPFPLDDSQDITLLDTENFRVSDGGYFPDVLFNALRALMGYSVYWVFIWYTFSRVMRILDNNNDDIYFAQAEARQFRNNRRATGVK